MCRCQMQETAARSAHPCPPPGPLLPSPVVLATPGLMGRLIHTGLMPGGQRASGRAKDNCKHLGVPVGISGGCLAQLWGLF